MANKVNLGHSSQYPEQYAPSLLEPIARANSRKSLFDTDVMPFRGVDLWTAYELSWLSPSGKPEVAIAEFEFPCDATYIIESKSFKYYLNSLNQSVFESRQALETCLAKDLGRACGADVRVTIAAVDSPSEFIQTEKMSGLCVDREEVEIQCYTPNTDLLKFDASEQVKDQALFSHLLKSNCPVTGQPDWASIWIEYTGPKINAASFLQYIVSFRQHQDFHENCVEKIFSDLLSHCGLKTLSVYARYTRRGGLDINPFRTNCGRAIPFRRLARQ